MLAWESNGDFKALVVGGDDSEAVAFEILVAEMALFFMLSKMPNDGAGQYSEKIFERFHGWRDAEHQG